jgi:PKHD-type hydroxylase
MPDQFIHIPGLLKKEELEVIDAIFAEAKFVDGRATATDAARQVKNNLQLDKNEGVFGQKLEEIISQALNSSPLFQAVTFPKYIYPPLFSKYGLGMYYGWHVDSPMMGNPPLRTDIAMTIFLSEPDSYTGGELVLQMGGQAVALKPAKGDAVVYPCQFLHCVNEIKSGERRAAVTWIQSVIQNPQQRRILFDLQQTQQLLNQKDPLLPEAQILLQTYSNLMRMWAGI